MQPLEGETFQDGEGYLITSIKYNGAVCTSVYQSLSDIQENKMQYIELDAKLKKNTSYQLCFEVLNTQRKIRAWGINASLEEPELGVQFLFLSPLSWVAYVELCGFINVNSYNNRVAIFKETKTVIVYYKMGSCIFYCLGMVVYIYLKI